MDLCERREGQTHRHPWELARLEALRRILRPMSPRPNAQVLDVGCGDGFAGLGLLDDLGAGSLTGLDANFTDADLEKLNADSLQSERPRAAYVRSWESLEGRRFDLVLLLDVIEHMEDDVGFLRRIRTDHLAEGGLVLITVPAFAALFSAHDRFLHHQRRYDRASLARAVREAGLAPQRSGYLFASLLLPRLASVMWERLSGSDRVRGLGGWRGGAFVTTAMKSILGLDNRVLHALGERGVMLPGLSTWALCQELPS